ncbi:sensor histidine kinase [uncultured Kordia sp.]|uniref:ATP-binding protein n=1 Tax=uncultured Kordia sp. TaxID=507699 RepID=UPI00262C38A3|nr:sensor histidine kinase [uncultured Kordia sp.]
MKNKKDDTTKVNYLNGLASKYKYTDSIARFYASEAKRISEKISYSKGLSKSLYRLGSLEKRKENYQEAETYYLASLNIREKNKNLRGIVFTNIQLSQVYQEMRVYEKAIQHGKGALETCLLINDEEVLALTYHVLATIYEDVNDYSASLRAYHNSIKIHEKMGDEASLADLYLSIGKLYTTLKKKHQAREYLNKSEFLNKKLKDYSSLASIYLSMGVNFAEEKKLDSALIFYHKSLSIKDSLNLNSKEAIYNNIGVVHQEKEEFELAEEFFLKSIETAKENDNEIQLLDTYLNLGIINRKQNKNQEALKFYNQSYALAKKYNKDLDRLNILMGIAETYEHLGDYKNASLFNERHIELRDSIDIKFRNAELYEKEKEKNDFLLKEKEVEEQKSRRKDTQMFALIGGIVLLALLFFAVFYAYRSKKEKESEIQKNIELLKKQELKSIKAMISGQESERKRIAQDLHDRLGSMLSMVKLNYKSIEDNLDKLKEENRKQYTQANALLDEACNAVREIAHNMVSGVLTKFGLVAALEDLKNTIQGTNTFQIEVITHGLDDRLENNLEMELYGITQELIHNVIKHAKAKEVIVQLVKRTSEINLTVTDDGIGFENSKNNASTGMGLKGIESRVDALKGIFHIDSNKGNGTTINIDIPI